MFCAYECGRWERVILDREVRVGIAAERDDRIRKCLRGKRRGLPARQVINMAGGGGAGLIGAIKVFSV